MRIAAFVLTLAFGGLQAVALSDCCCLSACEMPVRETPDCGDCGREVPEDCCDETAKVSCVHVQPVDDVLVHACDAGDFRPEALLERPVVERLPAPAGEAPVDLARSHRSERGRPLYLLDSLLLI